MATLKYSTRTDAQSKTDSIVCRQVNLFELFGRQSSFKIPTEQSQGLPTERFQLKIHIPRSKDDIVEIYYMSPMSVNLKCLLVFCDQYNEFFRFEKEFLRVQAKKWHYLTTIYKRTLERTTLRAIKCNFVYQSVPLNFNFPVTVVNQSELSDDFENLLKSESHSDVTMKSSEGTEFKVHKAVLTSRCAVLKAHFEHNTTECHTNTVLSPFEAEVLEEVLTFIYSEKAPQINKISEKLLAAAEYYQLNKLKSLCEEHLNKKLTITNALEILQLADLHSANTLKQSTLKFIKESSLKLITKTEAWSEIKSVELIKDICEYILADNDDSSMDPEIIL